MSERRVLHFGGPDFEAFRVFRLKVLLMGTSAASQPAINTRPTRGVLLRGVPVAAEISLKPAGEIHGL